MTNTNFTFIDYFLEYWLGDNHKKAIKILELPLKDFITQIQKESYDKGFNDAFSPSRECKIAKEAKKEQRDDIIKVLEKETKKEPNLEVGTGIAHSINIINKFEK